jgi:hypothetical protein
VNLVEFEREQIERLLGVLDARLKARGTPASVYVVGGAAIAMTIYDARRTIDIDAVVSDQIVLEKLGYSLTPKAFPRLGSTRTPSHGYLPDLL